LRVFFYPKEEMSSVISSPRIGLNCQRFLSLFNSNDYFRAGIGLLLFGNGIIALRKLASFVWSRIRRLFLITLEVNSRDESFQWLIEWLSEHPYSFNATEISLSTCYDSDHGNASNPRPKILITPSIGKHFLSYKGHFYMFHRIRDSNVADLTNGGFFEYLSITMFGRNRKAIQELIRDAMEVSYAKDEGKTILYTNNGHSWNKFGAARSPRPLSSVILDETLKKTVLNDIREFLNNSQWYRDMGIPYRRGYLFHGYPGSGKSSFVKAIAGELHMSVCLVNLNEKDLNDEQVNSLLNSAPPRSILLLEDIDVAFSRGVNAEEKASHITFSGLLNAMDGVAAQEGKLVFLTTNKVDRLDPTLIRPGRVDMSVFFGLASSFQIKEIFQRFYSKASSEMVERFVQKVPENTLTMAELQGYLMIKKFGAEEALSGVDDFLKNAKPHLQRGMELPSISCN